MTSRLALAVFLAAACGHQQEHTMPQTYTGAPGIITPTDPVDVSVPLGGDEPNAAGVVTPLQTLADWIAYLKGEPARGVRQSLFSAQGGYTPAAVNTMYEWKDLGFSAFHPTVDAYSSPSIERGSAEGRIKVNRAGTYRVRASTSFTASGAAQYDALTLRVKKVGGGAGAGMDSTYHAGTYAGGAVSGAPILVEELMVLAAGDEVAAYMSWYNNTFQIYANHLLLSVDFIAP